MKKLVLGVGILGTGKSRVNNKLTPAYSLWQNMIRRCYSGRDKSYDSSLVCEEWLYFPNFESWFIKNHREGCSLDKDILVPGNKLYSPETCVFVPHSLNAAVVQGNGRQKKDSLPKGVYITPARKDGSHAYQVKVGNYYVGTFSNPEDACEHFKEARKTLVLDRARKLHSSGMIPKEVLDAVTRLVSSW